MILWYFSCAVSFDSLGEFQFSEIAFWRHMVAGSCYFIQYILKLFTGNLLDLKKIVNTKCKMLFLSIYAFLHLPSFLSYHSAHAPGQHLIGILLNV